MIPFKTPRWQRKVIADKFKRKDRAILAAVVSMNSVMAKAIAYMLDHYIATKRVISPSLNDMDAVSETFYYDVIHAAFDACIEQKKANDLQLKKTQLTRMAKWPIGMPRTLKSLEKIFRDKKYWPKIMKRSKIMTDRLRKLYLSKLQKLMGKIIPDLDNGIITPEQAKKHLTKALDTTRSRVELIFRTETTTYFGKTQTAFFKDDPEIIGFLFDSVRDTSRTDWCKSRHGLIYKPSSTGKTGLSYNTPALHPNCRSHMIPLANNAINRKMLDDPRRNPDNRTVAELLPGWRK